ncbi:hypothetical protein [Chryseobacterium phocaeense]|uniref:hypothetical protein n=1 Tax=Chryseobacterium phocaeense TaxID=1816690 RepID=UPI0009BB1E43|nr:hypothetical protein [Chryseobacterium phocaeense]
MKKTKIRLFGLMLIPTAYLGQVGINHATPMATLDIAAKNAAGSSTNADGLLIPRVDRLRAQNMAGIQTSTMVFINNVANGTQTGKTANVDGVGYYYFNGTVWVKLHNPNNVPQVNNIYTNDGSLASNRTITQGGNTLAFTGTSANAFSVDGPTLSVDAAKNRIGVGTVSPATPLDIFTPTKSFGFQHTDGNIHLQSYVGKGSSNGNTEAAWFGTGSAHPLDLMTGDYARLRITQTGDTGVGTMTPQRKLHINGGLQVTNELNVGGSGTLAGTAGIAGQVLTSRGPGTAPQWTDVASAPFIPKVLAAGRTTVQTSATGNGIFFKYNFSSIGTNDGNWNTTTNTYTIPKTGYYQFSLHASISSDKSINDSDWYVLAGGSYYSVADAKNAGANLFKSRGGTIVLFLNKDTAVTFGSLHCFGCNNPPENYTIRSGATFAIISLGTGN